MPRAQPDASPATNSLEGRVFAVTDGDTFTVLDANTVQHRIRLAGIAAPGKREIDGACRQPNTSGKPPKNSSRG